MRPPPRVIYLESPDDGGDVDSSVEVLDNEEAEAEVLGVPPLLYGILLERLRMGEVARLRLEGMEVPASLLGSHRDLPDRLKELVVLHCRYNIV